MATYLHMIEEAQNNGKHSGCSYQEIVGHADAFLDSCLSIAAKDCHLKNCSTALVPKVRGLLDSAVSLFSLLRKYLPLVYHCGDADYGNPGDDFGAVFMILVTVVMAVLIVAATQYRQAPPTLVMHSIQDMATASDGDDAPLVLSKAEAAEVNMQSAHAGKQPTAINDSNTTSASHCMMCGAPHLYNLDVGPVTGHTLYKSKWPNM